DVCVDRSGGCWTSTDVVSALNELERLIGSKIIESITTMTLICDCTYTYVNESGASVVLDANTLKVVESSGVYTFVDAAGATVAVIDTNVSSSDLGDHNSGRNLSSTDVWCDLHD